MLTTFGFVSPLEGGILLVIALVIFGPGKLPDVGKALGKGIKEFKTASQGGDESVPNAPENKAVNLDKAE
ncbi:Sec-independent protein translocase TatA [Desulfosporosinus acidiphilus SJ4]|uniref:Sec-independent protein translocase protein TatA n=1 Tax=Desulfosporosinus acidiphilus (strain DSM 22704 / JCM 16185 / SJ4) TaxID=646529 RepID=I4D543_DESAJ|nr:twin-arginine translocase TatA/TatE family subunit [Desulfosporosinus acidiphilus]AFM40917.1 Sec-independent protein translocase TatA [Desulfosporosinus acidiphilus SJ4]